MGTNRSSISDFSALAAFIFLRLYKVQRKLTPGRIE
jgi:hypothetical protein